VSKYCRLNRFRLVALVALVWLVMGTGETSARSSSDWVIAEYGQVRLVAASSGLDENGQVLLGVQMRLSKGWKTYWRTPGETGIPATFDWSASENVATATLRWPAPTRFEEYGSQAFGYKTEVIFPVSVQAKDSKSATVVDLDLQFGVCRDICMPVELRLVMRIDQSGSAPTSHARQIAMFEGKVPLSGPDSPLQIKGASYDASAGAVTVELIGPGPLVSPDAVLELPPGLVQEAPAVQLEGTRAQIEIPVYVDPSEEGVAGRTVSIVAWDRNNRAVEKLVKIAP
jgi:suppressor for copper-sensitivity B